MKLYYAPGACSLSPHIVLCELGLDHQLERVDLRTQPHRTASGEDFSQINAKGYVPALRLDDGELLTEGPAIVQYLADQKPDAGLLAPAGSLARARAQEWLNYIATELHKNFGALFRPGTAEEVKEAARATIAQRLTYTADACRDVIIWWVTASVSPMPTCSWCWLVPVPGRRSRALSGAAGIPAAHRRTPGGTGCTRGRRAAQVTPTGGFCARSKKGSLRLPLNIQLRIFACPRPCCCYGRWCLLLTAPTWSQERTYFFDCGCRLLQPVPGCCLKRQSVLSRAPTATSKESVCYVPAVLSLLCQRR